MPALLTLSSQKSISTLLILLSIALTIACSSSPTKTSLKPTVSPQKPRVTPFNPLGDLLAQAQKALEELEDPHPKAQARVRYVIFSPQSLPSDEKTQMELQQAHFEFTSKVLKEAGLNSLIRSKLADRYTVNYLNLDQDLPININVFKPTLQKLGHTLDQFKSLIFVSYQGQALNQGQQLTTNCAITHQLSTHSLLTAKTTPILIGSLATFLVYPQEEFQNACQDTATTWFKPSIELVDKQVRLVSSGLSQWGRPDLELGPMSKDQARQALPSLVQFMNEIKLGRYPEQRQEHQLFDFETCLRPSHHYELECVRLVPKTEVK